VKRWAYYNEHDPFAAEWIRRLIEKGLIAPGVVDERNIQEVKADDLKGFVQCHFFAGIGGWSRALRLAGWDDSRPVWTGSCPCQPFSSAGKGKGGDDDRHLWPEWFRLIGESRPPVIFGEQVESAIRHGWLDLVSTDLEGEGYAFGSTILGAHSVGAPHIRQRLWFVAVSESQRRCGRKSGEITEFGGSGEIILADPEGQRFGEDGKYSDRSEKWVARECDDGVLANLPKSGLEVRAGREGEVRESVQRPERFCETGIVADPEHYGHHQAGRIASKSGKDESKNGVLVGNGKLGNSLFEGLERYGKHGDIDGPAGRKVEERHDSPSGFWDRREWLPCRDGKARCVESLTVEMAYGIPNGMGLVRYGDRAIFHPLVKETKNRVGRLKGYGNAIVPQVAAEFIKCAMEMSP